MKESDYIPGDSYGFIDSPQHFCAEERVIFDATFKTFRLYPGKSLYAFSISPELTLEHLYWGKRLPPGYDLRYLSQSSRMLHFNTAEQHASVADDAVRDSLFKDLEWVSIEKLQDTWRKSKTHNVDTSDSESLLQRRLENLSWRLMTKMSTCPIRSPRKKLQQCEDTTADEALHLHISDDEGDTHIHVNHTSSADAFELPLFTPRSGEKGIAFMRSRGRSVSNPVMAPLSAGR
jgi:hypothetical protein